MSDTELDEREQAADGFSGDKADADESKSLDQAGAPTTNFVFNAAADATGLGLLARAGGLFTKKRVAIGGGVTGGVVAIFLVLGSFSAFELVHFRENFIGPGNRLQNFSLRSRRTKEFKKSLEKIAKSGAKDPEDVLRPDTADKFRSEGFDIGFDESGKLNKFGFGGKDLALDSDDLKGAIDNFFASDVGNEAQLAFDRAVPGETATWLGKAARSVYDRLGIGLGNWMDTFRGTEDPKKSPTEQSADSIQASEKLDANGDVSAEGATHGADEGKQTDTNGEHGGTESSSNPADNLQKGAQNGADEATIAAEEQAAAIVEKDLAAATGKKGVDAGTAIIKATEEEAARLGASGTLKLAAAGAASFLDPLLVAQTVCKAKGTFQFVANARNVLLAIELARFSMRFLTIADHQKAGLLSGEGLKLYMMFLHREDPGTGGTFVNAGGVQNLLGNSSATVSQANLSKYSTGRANTGVFQTILNLLASFPIPKVACGVANNGWINIGAGAVGAVFAVFGGAEFGPSEGFGILGVASNILLQLGLEIATPFLIRLGAHKVFTGLESGLQGGEGISSGLGALFAMNGNSNGLRIATKKQVAELTVQEQADHLIQVAHQSNYQRYFALDNPDSLLAHTAMATYTNFGSFSQLGQRFASAFSSIPNLFSSLPFGLLPSKARVYAQDANQQCDDPQVKRLDVATDAFCNPLLVRAPDLDYDQTVQILKNNDMLDSNNQPQNELADYIKDCHTGRTGLLYQEKVSKNGETDATDDNCIKTDAAPLRGDNVNRYDRFTEWVGHRVDTQNFTDQTNGNIAANPDTMFQGLSGFALAGVQ